MLRPEPLWAHLVADLCAGAATVLSQLAQRRTYPGRYINLWCKESSCASSGLKS